jgi:N-acetylmuramoyl-L-alanine amidase
MKKFNKRIVVWLTPRSTVKILFFITLVIGFIFVEMEQSNWNTWVYESASLSKKVIILDAGHGGSDGGAVNQLGQMEKQINLKISILLRDYLQEAGAIVYMTREEDKDLANPDTQSLSKRKTEDLLQRGNLISELPADMFVSIHLNSIASSKWSGAQTFFMSNHPDNEKIAKLIQQQFVEHLKNTTRVANKTDRSIYLLKISKIPSVLIEAGFLSHQKEANQLSDEKYQRKIADCIYRGILKYYTSGKSEVL